MRRCIKRSLVAAVLVLALACSTAMANHSRTELVSVGPGGANVESVSIYDPQVSEDGTKAFFHSADAITPDDTDGLCDRNQGQVPQPPPPSPCVDLYQRDLNAKTTTLVSTGPLGGSGNFDANFAGMTGDGTRVYFETAEKLVPEDTDTGCSNYYSQPIPCIDVYERVGGTTRLISQGPGDSGVYDAFLRAISADGSRVFFATRERLTADDTDTTGDVYVRFGNETRLVGGGFDAVSADGTKVVISTNDNLVPEDTDTCLKPNPTTCTDIYLRDLTTNTVELVSTGPHGNQDRYHQSFQGATADLSHIYFETAEPLVDEDVEASCPYHDGWGEVSCVDVYERSGGTTKLISTGPKKTGNDGTVPKGTNDWATFDDFTPDGTQVFFHTREQLVEADTDSVDDAYMREGNVTTLLSGVPGDFTSTYLGTSDDGSRVFVDGYDRWSPEDTDDYNDSYMRIGASFKRLTFGPVGGNGPHYNSAVGNSADGRRFFFYTVEELTPDDANHGQDIYERFAGKTTLISKGPTGVRAGTAYSNRRLRIEDNGRHFYFSAWGRLVPEDQDDIPDLYVSIVNSPPSCESVTTNRTSLLSADNGFRTVVLRGGSDPDGDAPDALGDRRHAGRAGRRCAGRALRAAYQHRSAARRARPRWRRPRVPHRVQGIGRPRRQVRGCRQGGSAWDAAAGGGLGSAELQLARALDCNRLRSRHRPARAGRRRVSARPPREPPARRRP